MSAVNLRAYDHGRVEGLSTAGERLWSLLTSLAAVHAALAAFSARANDGTLSPLASARDCADAIGRAERPWKTGRRELIAYGPTVVATSGAATIDMVCGVEPLPVWVPNQVQIDVKQELDAAALEGLLRALATSFEPAWAHLAVSGFPIAPTPPFNDGAPVVGWMTFLSRDYPSAPAALPVPAVRREVGTGTLFVAHPTRADVASVAQLRAALDSAGVLLPAHRLSKKVARA